MITDQELDEWKHWAKLDEWKRWPLAPSDCGWPTVVREMLGEIERLREFEALAKETGIFTGETP